MHFTNVSRCVTSSSPPPFKVIEEGAFANCSNQIYAVLCEGLEEIEAKAFESCASLNVIYIPSSVREIHDEAFDGCSNLMCVAFWCVAFCDDIEVFVRAESMRS